MSREIMQQALDEMARYQVKSGDFDRFDDAIKNLRQALAQPEQEPKLTDAGADTNIPLWGLEPKGSGMVALNQPEQATIESIYETIVKWDEGGGKRSRRELARRIVALYTSPPRKEWVGLTDEEIKDIWINTWKITEATDAFAYAIEAKLKEINT